MDISAFIIAALFGLLGYGVTRWLQKREQATSARVQQVAGSRLQMRPANPGITQYVAPPAAPATSASGGQP